MDAVDSKLIAQEFLCGGIAGAVGVVFGFPFDLIKVKIQTNPTLYPTAMVALRSVLKQDGYGGLFKGCIPPVVMQGVINSLIFTGEGVATKLLEPDLRPGESASPLNSFLAGSCGGLLQCTVLIPSDVIKCTMQAGAMEGGSGGAFAQTAEVSKVIYRAEGLAGFYKGALVTVMREIPSIGVYFFSYKAIRSAVALRVEKRDPTVHGFSTPNILFSGGIAGGIAWSAIYPIDVIKTNMQASLSSAGSRKPGDVVYSEMMPWNVARHLHSKNGIKVFYRGIATTVARALPVNAIIFYVYEKLKAQFVQAFN
jgi:solute carrier family 25 carnitine/acylcarnitine transporter 20/29